MKKYILSIMICMLIPMVLATASNPTIAPNGDCYVEEPIKLMTGWNLISLVWNNGSYPLTGDRNVSVVSGLNLLGNSGVREFNVNDITFTNSTGTYSFADSGLSDISVYRDVTTGELGTTGILNNPKKIYPAEGFWINSNSDGNITLPNVGGADIDETFPWSGLRFSNGTNEKTFAEAKSSLWVENPQYWGLIVDPDGDYYDFIVKSSGNINSYTGYFVNSKLDNIVLIRDNSTESCNNGNKIKVYGNPSNQNKLRIYSSGTTNSWRIFTSHFGRLFGGAKTNEVN